MAEKKPVSHDGHRQRMKERFISTGLKGFQDHEVLEMLLFYALPYRDTNGLSHVLIDAFGDLANVMDADYADLVKIPGVTPHIATLLTLSGQMAHRYQRERYSRGTLLYTTEDLGSYVLPYFIGKKEEGVLMVAMDSKCKVLNTRFIFEGNVNSTLFNYRLAVQQALRDNATMIALAHNHPNGHAIPSNADIETTARFAEALALMDIRLVDHLIVAGDDFVSLAETRDTKEIFENLETATPQIHYLTRCKFRK